MVACRDDHPVDLAHLIPIERRMLLQQSCAEIGAFLFVVRVSRNVDSIMKEKLYEDRSTGVARKRAQCIDARGDMAPGVIKTAGRLIVRVSGFEYRARATFGTICWEGCEPTRDVVQMILRSLISRGFLRPSHHYVPCRKEEIL